ncbi:MAG TPA: hypothetical protein VJY62_19735 [Bacteroidia bacterium]|nr:hypothetical protein [Bacteroidia bacterium]
MPQVTSQTISDLLKQAIKRFLFENPGYKWKNDEESFKALVNHINSNSDLDYKLSYSTVFQTYYYKSLESSFKKHGCSYNILTALNTYSTGKPFSQAIENFPMPEYENFLYEFPNPATNNFRINFVDILSKFEKKLENLNSIQEVKDDIKIIKKILNELMPIISKLIPFKNVYIKDESTLPTGHFNDREAIDIFNIYRSLIEKNLLQKTALPVLSTVFKCKLAFSLQYFLSSFGMAPLRVLCKESERADGGKLEKIGCVVQYDYSDVNFNKLTTTEVLDLTFNRNGYYIKDQEYFAENKLTNKNALYEELFNSYADFLYIPFCTSGDMLKSLTRKRNELKRNPEACKSKKIDLSRLSKLQIIGAREEKATVINHVEDKSVIVTSKKYHSFAKIIYEELKMPASKMSCYALGCFIQQIAEDHNSFSPNSWYTILNFGESHLYRNPDKYGKSFEPILDERDICRPIESELVGAFGDGTLIDVM